MKIGGTNTIDFARVSKLPKFVIDVKSRDRKRVVSLILLENNTPINLNNYTVTVAAKKSDGNDIFNDVTVVDAKNGICEVEVTEQMLALDTDLPCEIVLYGEDGTVATSSNFVIGKISSVRDENSIISSSEFTGLTKALSEVKNIDNRFKEVNSQLEHKANQTHVWNMANMGQDVKEAMTGGSVAVVGKDTVLTENIV
ncbi:BppU family phage baseplate upper protein, partial [Romboutsia timonensis]|uniref:BppU family phage baseplate upper protein n=1 Tax=Romboutsia timonensis TaxID=1776391 RepID=UPI0023F9720A